MKKDEQVELVQIDAADLASSVSFSESAPFLFLIGALIACLIWKSLSLSAYCLQVQSSTAFLAY